MKNAGIWKPIGLAAVLVMLCVAVRMGVKAGTLPPNFAAVASVALFAGFMMKSRLLALATPILAMVISDMYIGFSPWTTMLVVYAALAAPALAGRWLARRPRTTSFTVGALGLSAVGASILFFGVTNFEAWFSWGMYERTPSGLAACYFAGLPFLKWTLASNVVFTGALFGTWALVRSMRTSAAVATA